MGKLIDLYPCSALPEAASGDSRLGWTPDVRRIFQHDTPPGEVQDDRRLRSLQHRFPQHPLLFGEDAN